MRIVTSQSELDTALAEKVGIIEIRSPECVWLTVKNNESSRVEAWESSRVVARGSASVEAWGSSRVEARESASVEAWESASVEARGSASVVARGSASVEARGSSRVEAWESASVVARESASVEAWESSRVEAWGSSRVEARESASVVARESASVEAWESASVHAYNKTHVKASRLVAVFLHCSTVDVEGGAILDHSNVDDMNGREWCEYHGVTVRRGLATLYKAVNEKWTTDRGTDYSPGSKPTCNDFSNDNSCGGGLHFGPTPRHARTYFGNATKFVAVGVRVSELCPIPGGVAKAKAPRVVRACVEVDIDGNPIGSDA